MFRALHKRARMPISVAINEWYVAISHLAPGTQKYYKQILSKFTANLPDKAISKLSSADIRNYLQQILWVKKKSSANKCLMAIRSFCRFAAENYNILNPAENVRSFRADPPRQPFITKDQYNKILGAATPHQRDVIQLLAMTGLRSSELASLEYENITENFAAIRFSGKGQRQRTVPLNNTARTILARHIKAETIINFPKNRKSIYTLCAQGGKKAQISLSPHTLRRLFATELVRHRKSLLEVSHLLGHSSVRTTEIYLHLDTSYLSGATDVLDG